MRAAAVRGPALDGFGPMLVLAALESAVLGLYVLARVPPLPAAVWCLGLAWGLLAVMWVVADARRRGRTPCFDFGLLVAVTFPVSLLWYCWRTRRWRGALVPLMMGGLFLTPWLVATALAIVVEVAAVVSGGRPVR